MPANKKYLTPSPWQRFAKISAAILGGLIVALMFHLALASWFDRLELENLIKDVQLILNCN